MLRTYKISVKHLIPETGLWVLFYSLQAYDTLNPRSLVLIMIQSLHRQLAKRTGQRNLRLQYFLSKMNPWPEVEVLELKLRDSNEISYFSALLHVHRAVTLSRPLRNTSAEQSFHRLNGIHWTPYLRCLLTAHARHEFLFMVYQRRQSFWCSTCVLEAL